MKLWPTTGLRLGSILWRPGIIVPSLWWWWGTMHLRWWLTMSIWMSRRSKPTIPPEIVPLPTKFIWWTPAMWWRRGTSIWKLFTRSWWSSSGFIRPLLPRQFSSRPSLSSIMTTSSSSSGVSSHSSRITGLIVCSSVDIWIMRRWLWRKPPLIFE